MTDSSGTVVWSADYKPFGESLNIAGSIINNLRFPGQYYDQETGLHYNYIRDFNPTIGRYIEADPIGLNRGKNHLYAYVASRPLSLTDVLGLSPLSFQQILNLVTSYNASGQSNKLIICMAYMESGKGNFFDPDAMQKAPNTARGLLGVTLGAADDLNANYDALGDPTTNIYVGTRYLYRRINWKRPFGGNGDVRIGLAGYGEGEPYADALLNCEKCMKNKPCDPMKQCLAPLHH